MTDIERIKKLLTTQKYMVISVVLENGTPWAVPVAIKRWQKNIFEWESMRTTEHSKALELNKNMAVTIFEAPLGFYAEGEVQLAESNDNGVGKYRFTASRTWMNDQTYVKRQIEL